MERSVLKQVALDQRDRFEDTNSGHPRAIRSEIEKKQNLAEHAFIITGVRRVGKSTLLRQLAESTHDLESVHFFNFEDDRLLDFESGDFEALFEVLVELFGDRSVFMLDEVQEADGWEMFVRRLLEDGYRVYLTGSNARLMSEDLSEKLTGRHLQFNVLPFSFREFLTYRGETIPDDLDRLTGKQQAEIKGLFNDYLREGGMPMYLAYEDPDLLKQVYEDVLYRDVGSRHNIQKMEALKMLGYFLLSNIGNLVSPSGLTDQLNVKSADTVRNWVSYLRDAWLFYTVPLYDHSVKTQQRNPKKVYCVDTGMVEAVAFSFSDDSGDFLENAVFLELMRRNDPDDLYYYKTEEDREVDFLVCEGPSVDQLIQVSFDVTDPETLERETESLFEAMEEHNLNEGLLLSGTTETEKSREHRTIQIIPTWKWML